MHNENFENKPPVWPWYTAYCAALAVVYLIAAAFGLYLLVAAPPAADYSTTELRIQGVIYLVIGALLFVPFAAAPFLPRKSWVWVYGLVLICLGMTSVCCLPATIPLLIFWLKPETKRFLGRQD